MNDFAQNGWAIFTPDPHIRRWANHAQRIGSDIAAEAAAKKAWLRHGATWFAGVNILPNDAQGKLPDGPALKGDAIEWLTKRYGAQTWDKAQLSIVYPNYPKQDADETNAAHRYRIVRHAAHVDGLLPIGPARRRFIKEPHSFILGLPLNEADQNASPLSVWQGSHIIMQDAFRKALAGIAPQNWPDMDITDTYHAARRKCFDECARVIIHAPPGGCYAIHRLALHGVAPWQAGAVAPLEGRMIAYFRPPFKDNLKAWLDAP